MVRKRQVNRCRQPRALAVFFGVLAVISLLPPFLPGAAPSTQPMGDAVLWAMFTFSFCFFAGFAVYLCWDEITWDDAGLTIRRGLRRRSCRWEEVVDFYETYEPRGLVIVGGGVVGRVLGLKSADGVDELREAVLAHCAHL